MPPAWRGIALIEKFARYALIAVLMATYIVGQAWSASFQDTARDMFEAYGIRHGLTYPLEGPILGDAVHLGPIWYYLMALPLWIHDSWLSSAVFAGLLGSLKFPLACYCGTRLVDRDYGLLWAIALALPGWHSLEQLVFFNPSPAAASMFLVLALVIHCTGAIQKRGAFAALGFLLAFALHVHPTTAPIIPIALLALWRGSRPKLSAASIAAIAAGFALPFLPYVASQATTGFPDWLNATGYVERKIGFENLRNWPALLAAEIWGGPEIVGRYVLGWKPGFVSALCSMVVAILMVPVLVLAFARRQLPVDARRLVVATIIGLFIFSVWVVSLRPVTPFYFVFVLSPLISALAATTMWLGWQRGLKAVVICASAAVIGLNTLSVRDMARAVRSGEGILPARIVDIKDSAMSRVFSDVWFPAVARQRLGRALCEEGRLVLHGHLAYLVDRSLGLDALFACGGRDHLALAGATGLSSTHLLGMTRSFWSRIDAAPDCWIGSLGLSEAHPISQASMTIADGSIYPPRHVTNRPARETVFAFAVPRAHAVLVSNITPGYQDVTVIAAIVNDVEVHPVATNDLSKLYAAPLDSPPIVHWQVRLLANEPQATDVVTIDRARTARSPQSCR